MRTKMRNHPESRGQKSEAGGSRSAGLQSSVFSHQSSVCRCRQAAAFTLMEMLVVLAVIGILTGLLFPALMGARERARITRARSEVQTLQQAWLAYWNTYGKWPGGVSSMTPAAVAILSGNNTYKIAFMEFDERHETEGFLDPWGNPYRIDLTDSVPATDVEWAFTTRAHCVNAARYKY